MRSARIHLYFAAAAALALMLSACSSTSNSDDAVLASSAHPAPAEKYPDFSKPLQSAMTQMSDEEAAQQEAQLSALSRQRKAGKISVAEYNRRVQELRLLGQQTQ